MSQDITETATLPAVPEWLTPTQAAAYLKVSRDTLYRLMREGRIRYSTTSWSGRRRIRREDLDRLLKDREEPEGR